MAGAGTCPALRSQRAFCPPHSRIAAKQLGNHTQDVSVARLMGHCKGKDNVKKRAVRRKKNERLALAKSEAAAK